MARWGRLTFKLGQCCKRQGVKLGGPGAARKPRSLWSSLGAKVSAAGAQNARRTSGNGQVYLWAGARVGNCKNPSPAAPLPYVDQRSVARIGCAAVARVYNRRAIVPERAQSEWWAPEGLKSARRAHVSLFSGFVAVG